MAARAARFDFELVEDRLSLRRARARRPLRAEPGVELFKALVGLEDAPHVELRRDGAVPAVLLEPEGDVEPDRPAEAVELGAEAEGDRTARVGAFTADAEAQVLALAHR